MIYKDKFLKKKGLVFAILFFVFSLLAVSAHAVPLREPLHCVAFSPYVEGYNPDYGPHPEPALIDTLLDSVHKAGFRCIMSYGALNGLDYSFKAAKARGMTVISIIWLDKDRVVNQISIAKGIETAKRYPKTIVRLSCGSEVRVRLGKVRAEPIIRDCLAQVRAAKLPQPVTSIDTWWGWCDERWPCERWSLVDKVDWIGVNVFPWWENKFSGLLSCTDAGEAAGFHVARMKEMMVRYPGKELVMTEFGWPSGPKGYRQVNDYTGKACDEASPDNQGRAVTETLARFKQLGYSAVVFSAFEEPWKVVHEGPPSRHWGICKGTFPYHCTPVFPFTDPVSFK